MKYYVLYNPHSNNEKGNETVSAVKAQLPADTPFYDVTGITDYAKFFEAIPEAGAILLIGGDGTLNHFINDISKLTLKHDIYYKAAGTGNDFLKDVKDPCDEKGFVKINKYLEDLPTVYVNGKESLFLNGIGYGIDGYCCEVGDKLRVESTKPVNYTSIAIKGLLFHYKTTNATVTVDGKKHEFRNVWLAPTMNGRFYGGGMIPTPDQDRLAKPKTLSVMVYHCPNKLKALMIFPSIFKGEHISHKDTVSVFTGKDITVEFDSPRALQIDGETVLGVKSYRALVK
jgi:diacylglycerol kinase (ATP)